MTRHFFQLAPFALFLALGLCLLPSGEALAAKGKMYVSKRPFALSASSNKELMKKARRNHQKRMSWSKGDPLRFQMMFFSKGNLRTTRLYLVLFRKGKKGYVDSRDLPVKRKQQIVVTWLNFSGNYLKRGGRYELRAIRVTRGGKVRTVLAKARFRLK